MDGERVAETGEVGFSVVIPVHNEAKMLTYTLPSIYGLRPKEVVFVLDRCTDSTEKIIRDFWKKFDSGGVKLVLLRVQRKSRWKMHLNLVYDLGIRKAESKIVLLSQADILHDYGKIKRNIKDALHGMVSFAVLEHPHISPWNHFVTKILQITGDVFGVQRFSGVIAFCKDHFMTCPLVPVDSFNFDTQLQINFKKRMYPFRFVLTKNLNLRPWVRSKLWGVGVDRYKMKKSFLRILVLSFVRFTPEVVAGYLHASLSRR